MANKPATPGTGLRGPIYILDQDGNVVGELDGTEQDNVLVNLQDIINDFEARITALESAAS